MLSGDVAHACRVCLCGAQELALTARGSAAAAALQSKHGFLAGMARDLGLIAAGLYNLLVMPFRVAFLDGCKFAFSLLLVDVAADLVLLADIVLRLRGSAVSPGQQSSSSQR